MGNVVENLFPLVTKHFLISPKDEKKLWDEEWTVTLKDGEKETIGHLKFEEAVLHGEVHLSLDVEPSYDKTEYDAEIYYSMARFLFRLKEVREISTESRYQNEYRIKGLEKAGYVRRETRDGSVFYSIKKQKTSWTGFYVVVGMIAGFLIGITVSNLWLGTIAGVMIGAVIGIILDKREDKD